MQIIVPIYVLARRGRGSTPPIEVRPLFFDQPSKSGTDLGRVIAAVTNRLRVQLADLARQSSHDSLLQWHQNESIDNKVVKLELDLRDSTSKLRVLLASVHRHGSRFAFSPSLPELWFDVRNGESLEQRASEVYESYFRELRKETPNYPVSRHGIEGKAWVDYVTIDVVAQREPKPPADPLRAFLGGEDVSDGAAQLRAVGRCLNWVDPGELAEPNGVDRDVQRLIKLLDVGDRRGVVLVGPPGSGKTARIEGAVRQRRKRKQSATHGLVWHLAPARLISGMSYLGQWQERVLAILRHAHHHDHVLYFDDLLGLQEAGKTRDSSMCVADTLRAQLDVRPVRLLAEMTTEGWAILRERDRTLADRLVVMPTAALDTDQSTKILIGVRRRLEASRRCKFDLEVLPEVISIYDRFERSSVLPGKAAAAMARLAASHEGHSITRKDAIQEFQLRSGLQASIIDRAEKISRESITARIREQVVGQDDAVAKLVDRILIAAARMNDTTRPLGTFLLIGPTGVGKTQLAKAVASCLFEEGNLIRLDMNELSSPMSAARLVGTFDAPDGLLTAAVRRRPNAVLLLDEIEKAHPSVLDVLLQALGEARLSDARGRTVDLSGLLILMTSNLGSRESGRGRGFSDSGDHDAISAVHQRAARDFFRPEFFNRIDDVLSFERLSAEVMESIAWMQFQEILRRDGLQRRSVLIDIDPAAIRQTARRGHDPAMGARSLKRQIERDLVRPAAEVLAASTTDKPTLLRLSLDGSRVITRWQPVDYVDRDQPMTLSMDEICRRSRRWLDTVADQIDTGPLSFELNGQGVDPSLLETMTLRDSLHECQQSLRQIETNRGERRLQRPQSTPVHAPRVSIGYEPHSRTAMRDLQAIEDIQDFLRDSLVETSSSELDSQRDRFIEQLCRLHQQLDARGSCSRWLVWTRWFGDDLPGNSGESQRFKSSTRADSVSLSVAQRTWATTDENLSWESVDRENTVSCYSGALAAASLAELCGGWMFVFLDGHIRLADVRMRAIDDDQSPREASDRWRSQAYHEPLAAVRRVINAAGPLVDLRTGAVVNQACMTEPIIQLLRQARSSTNFLSRLDEVTS